MAGLTAGDARQTTARAPLVVHVFPGFGVGGAQVRFSALANHFGAAFRHVVVSLNGDLGCRERLRPDLDVAFPAVAAPKRATIANVRRFRRLLRAWRPALLVTNNWGAIEWAMANLVPVARHVHIEDGFGPEERDRQFPRRSLIRRLVLARSTVVLPSRNLQHIATTIWHLPEARVRYIPNGIDLERFAAARAVARAANTPPVIGTVAALRAEKNLSRLLRAFAAVTRPARLVIVGDGPERGTLEELTRALGLQEQVRFAGHIDDPAPLYAGFDVFALSSDTEQMPLSVIEAMAAGLPVAATDVGDVRAMLSGENAPFVGKPDDADLARSLTALLENPALRARICQANQAKARAEFDQAAMFRAYGALWRNDIPPAEA
ncbi:MAG TPA: glycosyltransferase [Acetobacteraceae bacterium]|nr:glycosyltransferase [Acetobacteraceae bacterium]